MSRPKYLTIAVLVSLTGLVALPANAEEEAVPNRITVYLRPGGAENQAVLEVWMSNANPVRGITLPFKFATGGPALSFDSLKLDGGRLAAFTGPKPNYKPENQTLLVNLLQGLSKEKMAPPVPVGVGPIAWLYLSTKEKFPLADFKMASVQIEPQNVLLYVTDTYNSVHPDFLFTRESPPTAAKPAEVGDKGTAP